MAKQTTPEQHRVLERYWPNNCCLCMYEARITELELRLNEAEQTIILLRDASNDRRT